ncbi:MAG: hypothetical protein B7X36_04170, partial [Thiomonas sp. 14-64-326]
MEQAHSPICPFCGSGRTAWKAKSKVWECLDCEKSFDPPPPEVLPDPLASVEDAFAQRARALADSPSWVQSIIDSWPAPIAATYALLRTTLRDGKIDASAIVFKDLAELLARFSALTLACDILQNGPADKQIEVLTSLFAKPLAMGDWVSLADAWSKWLETAPQREQDWITRPIARIWRHGNQRTPFCGLMSDTLVHWRNETIGHGVRGSDLGPTMDDLERFLGHGEDSLHLALAPDADLGSTLVLVDPRDQPLVGAQAMHDPAAVLGAGHVLGPQQALALKRLSDNKRVALRSFMALRRCEVCGQAETFHFDSAKPKRLMPDFRVLNYERGHALRVPASADADLLHDWSRVGAPVEADEDQDHPVDFDAGAALPADVVAMLDEQAIERGYLSPTYLRDPLAEFIQSQRDADQGGLYWLRAPAHVGKSTFVQGLDPQYAALFKEPRLVDALAVAVFTIRREYQYHLGQFADILRERLKQALNLASGSQKLPELDIRTPSPEALTGFLAAFQKLGRKPILVIIDGLDELADVRPSILDLLPTPDAMPADVFLLLTSRPLQDCPPWMRHRLEPLLVAPGRQIGLSDADYTQLLSDYAKATLRGKKSLPDLGQLLPKLLERSDGRFLYFRFLVDRLAEGDLKTDDLDALTRPDNLLPQFVQALQIRYADTPMGDRIQRTLASLALAEDAFNRKMQGLPVLAQDTWQGLPMPVLCEMIEGTPRMTPNMASMLYLLKPLLGTWRGDSTAPRYRLGIKGLEDILRQQSTQSLPALAARWVDNLLQRQTQWLQASEAERGSPEDDRGGAQDWVLRHLDGLLPLLTDDQRQSLRGDAAWLQSLSKEMMDRADAAQEQSRNRDALHIYAVVEALLRWGTERHEPDAAMWTDPAQRTLLDSWLGILNNRGLALLGQGDAAAALADDGRAIAIREALREQLGAQFSPAMANNLASAYLNRGNVLLKQGDATAALEDYGRSIAIREALREQLGAQFSPAMAGSLASAYLNRGVVLFS